MCIYMAGAGCTQARTPELKQAIQGLWPPRAAGVKDVCDMTFFLHIGLTDVSSLGLQGLCNSLASNFLTKWILHNQRGTLKA